MFVYIFFSALAVHCNFWLLMVIKISTQNILRGKLGDIGVFEFMVLWFDLSLLMNSNEPG